MSSAARVHRVLTAMHTVEDDVAEPSRQRSGSFVAALCDLTIGETASKVRQVLPHFTLEEVAEHMPAWREQLRNACTPSVRQAKQRTGGEYTIEITDAVTPGRRLYVIALITRTA